VKRRHWLRTSGAAWAGAAIASWLVVAACRTMQQPASVPVPIPAAPEAAKPTVGALVPEPSVRVGILVDVARVSIGAQSGVVVQAASRGTERRSVQRATFVPVATGAPAAPRFRVQAASLAAEPGAQNIAARVEETVQLKPTVQWNASTRTYQVRAGEFATRDEALGLANRLSRSGIPGAFVVEDRGPALAGRIRLIETGEELVMATVLPAAPNEGLAADASAYRGVLEVRAGETGGLTLVNIVNIEDYLRGVVPNELSPAAFPEIEALKAQAVAARSYVLNHKGEFAAKGYDICATPACQVYRGQSTEHELTDRAVEETRGMVASWRGRPINAFYTSTCGGHTEDGENIFDGESISYLRGVACAPERSARTTIHTSRIPKEIGKEPGLGRDIALLTALGVLDASLATPAKLLGIPTDVEIRGWVSRVQDALHRKGCESPVNGALARRGTFAQYVVGSLCWEERGRRLLAPPDADYLLAVEDRASLAGDDERLAAAVLIQEGVLSPFPDNTLRPGAALTRAEALMLLAGAAERAGPPGLFAAEFAGTALGQITVLRGETAESYPIDPSVGLFRNLDGVHAAASELNLALGDRVNIVLSDGRVVFLEAEQSRKGAASDRGSRYYRWEVRLTPADLSRTMVRYGSIGTVRDIAPRRIGVSGRVVELAVQGSGGEIVLKGLRVRAALGLRENLFVIDREIDSRGAIERFVITGKGWGHGVGLCQVGAFGMAQAGSTYEQILQHYYTGVGLERAY
jgi:stage II sporulation protein D